MRSYHVLETKMKNFKQFLETMRTDWGLPKPWSKLPSTTSQPAMSPQKLTGPPYYVDSHYLKLALRGDDSALTAIGNRHGKLVYDMILKMRG